MASRIRKLLSHALLLGILIAGRASASDVQTLDGLLASGPDIPTYGRSLFDTVLAGVPGSTNSALKVPFPFSALLAQIRTELQRESASDSELFNAVLIPIGRSLQRNTAAPDYFHSPRVVVAVHGESETPGAPLLKDRLYLGYQPQSGVLEVISYNEAMGRFEFQIVKDYREHATPQLYYAPRMICMACHQNQAPIFSRPLWRETNANPKVAAELLKLSTQFQTIPIKRGIDIPAAIDAATDTANGFALSQQLWREGCALMESALDCRATLLNALLQLRLSGGKGYADDGPLRLDTIRKAWQARWPGGLTMPNPDLPDRDPLADAVVGNPREMHVSAADDPLALRPPLELLHFDEATSMARVVAGLAEFMGDADIHHIDTLLTKAASNDSQHYDAACQYQAKSGVGGAHRVDVKCASAGVNPHELELEARLYFKDGRYERGVIDRLRLQQENFTDVSLEVDGGRGSAVQGLTLKPRANHFGMRRVNGALVSTLQLTGFSARKIDAVDDGALRLEVRDDYVQVQKLLRSANEAADTTIALSLSDQPLRRVLVAEALFSALGEPRELSSAALQRNLPPPRLEYHFELVNNGPADMRAADALGTMQRYCAGCHDSAETFPPNFLSGDAASVANKLRHCAERINFRLAMWALDPADRIKSPMPPESALHGFGRTPAQWLSGAELQHVEQYIQGLVAESAAPIAWTGTAYEQLQSCLPEGG